jgi:radical SAM superfamily enzyme YgiQ (UPF0313 family)
MQYDKHIEKSKCILISTPMIGNTLPRGILSIASFLEKNGYSTSVINLSYYLGFKSEWSFQDIKLILEKIFQNSDPILIGVSNQITPDYYCCLEILKICKQLKEKIITVIGGTLVTFIDIDCIESPLVDIVVRGEGEWTMLDLVTALEENKDLRNVKGITFKTNKGVIRTADRDPGNLYNLPPIDFKLLPFDCVKKLKIYGMLNRGCAFNCSFCGESAFWKSPRNFPVETVIDEMKTLNNVYKNPMLSIDDSMVYLGSKQFSEICKLIKKDKININPYFYILSRVDTISDKGLRDLTGTGIQIIIMGMESGSSNVLEKMNKKTSREKIIRACKKLRENSLFPMGFWMIGHPGDNPDAANSSLELLRYLFRNDLLYDADISIFSPSPGTPYFEHPERYGIEILSNDWSEWYTSGASAPVCQLKHFSANEIMMYYKNALEIVQSEKPKSEISINSPLIDGNWKSYKGTSMTKNSGYLL